LSDLSDEESAGGPIDEDGAPLAVKTYEYILNGANLPNDFSYAMHCFVVSKVKR
jgi:hypothetical protein